MGEKNKIVSKCFPGGAGQPAIQKKNNGNRASPQNQNSKILFESVYSFFNI